MMAFVCHLIQKVQLWQKDRAMLRVVKNFAAVTQGHSRSFENTPMSIECV